ncbi:MAG: hypothetical protein J0L99_09850 [Chitinophagales bacterium]|nr:hypothetical protein [Chitinophagales bacterium]
MVFDRVAVGVGQWLLVDVLFGEYLDLFDFAVNNGFTNMQPNVGIERWHLGCIFVKPLLDELSI